MSNPSNVLPADPEWLALTDRISRDAAAQLKCMVLMVAVQPEGKMAVSVDGVPDSGPLHEMSKDVPRMLLILAKVLHDIDEHEKDNPQ